jgi:hypothetical protein
LSLYLVSWVCVVFSSDYVCVWFASVINQVELRSPFICYGGRRNFSFISDKVRLDFFASRQQVKEYPFSRVSYSCRPASTNQCVCVIPSFMIQRSQAETDWWLWWWYTRTGRNISCPVWRTCIVWHVCFTSSRRALDSVALWRQATMMVVTSAKTLFSSAAPPGGSTCSKSPPNWLSFSIAVCLPPNPVICCCLTNLSFCSIDCGRLVTETFSVTVKSDHGTLTVRSRSGKILFACI